MKSLFTTFLLVLGVLGNAIEKRTSRTSTPSGCLTVKASGASSGQYSSLSAAISALGTGTSSSSACIFMYGGTYREQVKIKTYKGSLTIYGYTTDTSSYTHNQVNITYGESAGEAGSDEASSTVDITVSNFKMYNINIDNSYGEGSQAIAVTSNGNQQSFYGCVFKGYQDTLYAHSGYQYYKKCLIQGAVDYIFGDAQAWFEECTIQSTSGGAITAMHRGSTSETTWYVLDHCTVEAASGYTATHGVYLGRPWGVDARVIYQYCSLSDIINPAGWTTMAAGATPTYYEYDNTGAGAATASRKYETKATGAVSMSQIFPSGTSWIDSSY